MSKSRSDFGSPDLMPEDPSKMNSPDDRSAQAKAAAWVSRIITISIEMVVPGLIGYWLDTKLGTKFVLMLAGFVFGVTFAIKHLLKLTQKKNQFGLTKSTPAATLPFSSQSQPKHRKDQEL